MPNSSNEPIPFLNPDTYLNHLSPSEGVAFVVRNDIRLFLLGVALWDILAYADIDIRIVRTSRFGFVIFCFIFSRLFALGMLVGFEFEVIYIVAACFATLSLIAATFLFLQRVLAVYHAGSKLVRRAFFIFWVVVSLSDVLITFGGRPFSDIPATPWTKDSGVASWVAISAWRSFVFDTAVTVAISYKMWSTHRRVLENRSFPWYQVVSGKRLPLLSRSVFRGGLHYYLINVWAVLTVGITLWISSIPQLYKITLPVMQIFLTPSMASHVHRNIKLFEADSIFTETNPVVSS